MPQTWSLGRRLLVMFGLLLGVVAVACAVGAWNASSLRAVQGRTEHSAERVRLAAEIAGLNSEMFAAERAIMVAFSAGDTVRVSAWHEKVDKTIETAKARASELERDAALDADRQAARELKAGIASWESGCAACHDQTATAGEAETMQRLSAKTEALVDTNKAIAERIGASQRRQFEEAAREADRTSWRAMATMIGVLGLALAVGAGVLVLVRHTNRELRGVSSALRSGAMESSSSAAHLAESAQQLSHGAVEQASSVEEASASMEEISTTTQQNSAHAKEASELFAETDRLVQRTNASLEEMVRAMADIREASRKVAQVIKTVDEIAFQTNILALNAAVEAARAGEVGAGFAVVADEVRRLAQRSAEAAGTTASLIEGALTASNTGAARVEEVSGAVADITRTVSRVRALVDEVSEAGMQQRSGLEQVTQALAQIEQVARTTAASAEQSASASEQLHAQTQQTTELVQRLDDLVGGASATGGASGAARGLMRFRPARQENATSRAA